MSEVWYQYICDTKKCVNFAYFDYIEIFNDDKPKIKIPENVDVRYVDRTEKINEFSNNKHSIYSFSPDDVYIYLKSCQTNLFCTKTHLVGMTKKDVYFVKSKNPSYKLQIFIYKKSFINDLVYLIMGMRNCCDNLRYKDQYYDKPQKFRKIFPIENYFGE